MMHMHAYDFGCTPDAYEFFFPLTFFFFDVEGPIFLKT